MKETPLLLTGDMVRSTLDGTKSQTRRVLKLPLTEPGDLGDEEYDGPIQYFVEGEKLRTPARWGSHEVTSPYGKAGDRLWAKETFFDAREWKHALLFADGPDFYYRADPDPFIGCHHWKPSIFMSRELSRLTLEIVNIRVQRLQDIGEEDAIAEGVTREQIVSGSKPPPGVPVVGMPDAGKWYWRGYHKRDRAYWDTARESYRTLWNSINLSPSPVYAPRLSRKDPKVITGYRSYPWSAEDFARFYPESAASGLHHGKPLTIVANPHVWAITFKRITPAAP